MSDGDSQLELEFGRPAGADMRALKSQLYLPRDATLLAYLLLSSLSYLTRSIPLSLLVLVLNCFELALCFQLKGTAAAAAGLGGSVCAAAQVHHIAERALAMPLPQA